jgi:hypothetical protein
MATAPPPGTIQQADAEGSWHRLALGDNGLGCGTPVETILAGAGPDAYIGLWNGGTLLG